MNKVKTVCAIALLASLSSTAQTKIVEFPPHRVLQVELTVLKRTSPTIGRATPFYDGYRPQFHFSAGEEVTCSITLPKPKEKVEPGEITDATIDCNSAVKMIEGDPGFTVHEGGRKVATGHFK